MNISQLQFGILSEKEIRSMSVCKLNNPKVFGSGSVYDERMGTLTETHDNCITCGVPSRDCPGHFGYIEFHQPILHPLFLKVISLFLTCICNNCHRVIVSEEQLELWGYDKAKGEKRFLRILKKLEKNEMCAHCKSPQPKVIFKPKEGCIYFEFRKKEEKLAIEASINDIQKIFSSIPDEDIELLGFDPTLIHPKNLILSTFPVLPPCSRPYIVTDGTIKDGGNVCDDDLTTKIVEIIKDNLKLQKLDEDKTVDEVKRKKLINSLKFHVSTFYDNSKNLAKHPTDNQPTKGLKERLAGKEGQFRKHHMGKRVDFSARSVIGPDPTLKLGQLSIPYEVAETLTFPERVTDFNREWLQSLVENNKVNFVLRNGGKTRINMKYAMFRRGTELLYDDIILRNNKATLKDYKKGRLKETDFIKVRTGRERLEVGDRVIRDGELLENVKSLTKKSFILQEGDIVERQLMDNDIVLLNRNPTLHRGSMMAMEIVVKPHKTFRFNLSVCKSFNSDYDGDEMNIHAPQSYEASTELRLLSHAKNHIISPQESKPNIVVIQDSLLGAYLMTKGCVEIDKDTFMNICMKMVNFPNLNEIRLKKIERKLKKHNKTLYSGHGLFSLLFPRDFYYENTNKVNDNEPTVRIYKGIFYEGTLNNKILGSSHGSVIQILHKEYGKDITADFIDNVQFITNNWLLIHSFSIGLEDCLITDEKKINDIKYTLIQYYTKAQGIEEITHNPLIKEARVTATLSQAKDIGMKIAKETMSSTNNFLSTVKSGSKGDFFNIAQITGLLGQQNITGGRVKPNLNHKTRTLPHYSFEELSKEDEYESKGFIRHSFIRGLNPQEFFFHAISGREGICSTAMSTADSGYIQRRIIKLQEDIQVQYDSTVRDTIGSIYQLSYGENGLNPIHMLKIGSNFMFCNIDRIVQKLNYEYKKSHKL